MEQFVGSKVMEIIRDKKKRDERHKLFYLSSWWSTAGVGLPNLNEVAKQWCSVQACSATSERSFSKAGYVLNRHRGQLNGVSVWE